MKILLTLLLAGFILLVAATAKQERAVVTILSDSQTFKLIDGNGNQVAEFMFDDELILTIKRKSK